MPILRKEPKIETLTLQTTIPEEWEGKYAIIRARDFGTVVIAKILCVHSAIMFVAVLDNPLKWEGGMCSEHPEKQMQSHVENSWSLHKDRLAARGAFDTEEEARTYLQEHADEETKMVREGHAQELSGKISYAVHTDARKCSRINLCLLYTDGEQYIDHARKRAYVNVEGYALDVIALFQETNTDKLAREQIARETSATNREITEREATIGDNRERLIYLQEDIEKGEARLDTLQNTERTTEEDLKERTKLLSTWYESVGMRGRDLIALTKPIILHDTNFGRKIITISPNEQKVYVRNCEEGQPTGQVHPNVFSGDYLCDGNTDIKALVRSGKFIDALVLVGIMLNSEHSGSYANDEAWSEYGNHEIGNPDEDDEGYDENDEDEQRDE